MTDETLLIIVLLAVYVVASAFAIGWPHFLRHPWAEEDCERCRRRLEQIHKRAADRAVDEFNEELRRIMERRLRR